MNIDFLFSFFLILVILFVLLFRNKEGFNLFGYNRRGFKRNKLFKGISKFDNKGYDFHGYNYKGFDKNGFNKKGFNAEGFNAKGFNVRGFNKEGFDYAGFNEEGFDVVIGNPPYIHFEKIRELSNNLYKPLNYKTYEARGDIYALFYEMGVNTLKPNGHLCYITSNKWMRSGYGESLRKFFIDNTHIKLLIDLGSGVFKSATVDTNILLAKNIVSPDEINAVGLNKNVEIQNLTQFVKTNIVKQKYSINDLSAENIVIL
jgi:type I restriction-modification system DNA methylase subunit